MAKNLEKKRLYVQKEAKQIKANKKGTKIVIF